VPALASALRRVDEYDERVRIAEALGAIGKSASSAISPLERAAVEDESEDVRLAAVRALGVARSPAALTALRSLLFADDVMIRGAALRAMSEFGVNARDAIPDLCRALADTRWGRVRNDYDQRIDIFGVLELMKSVAEPAIPELRRALDEPDPHFGLRAVDVLQAIGSAALGALKTALKNDDAAVREAAKEAIESLRLAATR
jgi:HEAT repeat protein